jgi:hypothetical protein
MDLNDDTPGIYVLETRTFYYMVTGGRIGVNVVDKLRGILLRRGILSHVREDPRQTKPSYRIIKYEEAAEKGIQTEAVYASQHIKKVALAKEKAAAEKKQNRGSGGWG